MKENNLIGLAKAGKPKKTSNVLVENKEVQVKEKEVKKTKPVKKISKEEERDIMARKRVEELLGDVEILPKLVEKKEEKGTVETEETVVVTNLDSSKNKEWLEEQVSLLSSQNETLRNDLFQIKEAYDKLYADNLNPNKGVMSDASVTNLVVLFNELQANLMGLNNTRTQWEDVKILHVLNKLLELFPFLGTYKRY